jgi:hypothetical protein
VAAVRENWLTVAAYITPIDLATWVLFGLAIIAAGGIVIAIRRRVLERQDKPGLRLTTRQIEKLRSDGLLTAEEYRRAKLVLAGKLPDKTPAEPPEKGDGDASAAPGDPKPSDPSAPPGQTDRPGAPDQAPPGQSDGREAR